MFYEADESAEQTKDKYVRDIHSVAFPDKPFAEECITEIKRVGKFSQNNTRMVLVKFKNDADKFEIFKAREPIRQKEIRVSSDLTYTQRSKLKTLRENGISAYYKNGSLIYREQTNSENRDRRFRRGYRRLDNDNQNARNKNLAPGARVIQMRAGKTKLLYLVKTHKKIVQWLNRGVAKARAVFLV